VKRDRKLVIMANEQLRYALFESSRDFSRREVS
jgi:hypothetical protein